MIDEDFNNFDPINFLELAKELNKHSDKFKVNNSVVERNIFGRLYYGLFLYIREWLSKNWNYKSNPRRDHTQMMNFISKKGPFNEKKNTIISDSLRKLKKLRHQSDYYLKIPKEGTIEYNRWVFEDVDYAFRLAKDIFDSFEELEIKNTSYN